MTDEKGWGQRWPSLTGIGALTLLMGNRKSIRPTKKLRQKKKIKGNYCSSEKWPFKQRRWCSPGWVKPQKRTFEYHCKLDDILVIQTRQCLSTEGNSKQGKTWAKDILPNIHHSQATESSRHPLPSPRRQQNDPVSCCTSFAAYSTRLTMHCQWGGCSSFSSFVPGDLLDQALDLDIQTRPSEGQNTSSLWIWCKSVQQFLRYLMHKWR